MTWAVAITVPVVASGVAVPTWIARTTNLLGDIASSTVIEYDTPVYECRFECIPATVTYRPPRVTPWPVVRGTQTARVVGPQNEEIYTDEYGRVKVQFNWDREGKFDEKSSCWIRVSHGMAGGQYGMLFLPRVGQEVIVDFLEGIDSPVVTTQVIGVSDEAVPRDIVAIKISDNPLMEEDEFGFLFAGVIHGNEALGIQVVLQLIEDLTEGYDSDPEIQSWVDAYEIWFIPVINPYGYDNNRRKNGPDTGNVNTSGVDLNRNFDFRWSSGGDTNRRDLRA